MSIKFGQDYVEVDKIILSLTRQREEADELDERASEFLGIDHLDNQGRTSARYIARKVDFMGRETIVTLRQSRWENRAEPRGDVHAMILTPGMQCAGTGVILHNSPSASLAWNEAIEQAQGEGNSDPDYIQHLIATKAQIQFDAWWREMEGLLLSM